MTAVEMSGTALVFGGSRGIGAAIAKRLASDGFRVALTYLSREDQATAVVSQIEARGGKAIAIQADSADPQAIRAAVSRTVDHFGVLDVAVINAGVLRLGTIDSVNLEDLDLMLAVNVRGVFLSVQAAAERMRNGGRIVTIGSNSAVRTGSPGGGAYAMTKAAVASLARNAALDLAPRRITVNNIQPGPTTTDMTATFAAELVKVIPLKRMGQPEEIASLVSHIAGRENGYMTGTSVTIDGGYVL
jgi:3-oxoacyl-[acyl-carrier protein] reductase